MSYMVAKPAFFRNSGEYQAWLKANQDACRAARVVAKASGHCTRCGGSGKLDMFKHVEDGRCFQCEGTGKKLSRKCVGA